MNEHAVHLTRVNPVRLTRRSWRRFARRTTATKVRTVALVVAVVAGLAVWVGNAPSASAATASTPPAQASTSNRGVTSTSINVVFPVVDLNSLAGKIGFAQDAEFGFQNTAINIFVRQINSSGGINGRKINAIITKYDPTNQSAMRALCKNWTEGSPPAFVVLDGIGSWIGDNQLCVTQEGQTPLISQWSTIPQWTQLGSPYLWWTGVDQASMIKTTVAWGLSSGRLGKNVRVGIIAGDRTSDQTALKDYLLPDLAAAHVLPVVETIAADPSNSATTGAQAPLIVAKLKADGVQSVIPLIPFNVFFPVLQAQTQQQYFPKLLLSDYENSITAALGIIPVPYNKALNGQEGVTTLTLGGIDDNRPEAKGGYDPTVRSCYATWHAAHPQAIKGANGPSIYIEEQGPIQGWCQAIRLFAAATKAAGTNLNRRTFAVAMSGIKNFPGTYSPVLSYGTNKFAGPIEYQVVRLHNNVGKNACVLKTNGKPQGTCWQVVQGWKPLVQG